MNGCGTSISVRRTQYPSAGSELDQTARAGGGFDWNHCVDDVVGRVGATKDQCTGRRSGDLGDGPIENDRIEARLVGVDRVGAGSGVQRDGLAGGKSTSGRRDTGATDDEVAARRGGIPEGYGCGVISQRAEVGNRNGTSGDAHGPSQGRRNPLNGQIPRTGFCQSLFRISARDNAPLDDGISIPADDKRARTRSGGPLGSRHIAGEGQRPPHVVGQGVGDGAGARACIRREGGESHPKAISAFEGRGVRRSRAARVLVQSAQGRCSVDSRASRRRSRENDATVAIIDILS